MLRRPAQIDRPPRAVHIRHVVAPDGQAAARGDDGGFARPDRLLQHLALDPAETRLARVTEDVGHGGAFAPLDERIRIGEGDAEPPGQLAAERTLAATHVSHQKQRLHLQKRFNCSGSITSSASPFARSISNSTPPATVPD